MLIEPGKRLTCVDDVVEVHEDFVNAPGELRADIDAADGLYPPGCEHRVHQRRDDYLAGCKGTRTIVLMLATRYQDLYKQTKRETDSA